MKHYRIRISRQPKPRLAWGAWLKSALLWPFKTLPLLSGMFFPTALLLALMLFGLPGVLVHEGPWGCTYQDLIGTYLAMPYRSANHCDPVSFRPVSPFPSE